MNITKVETPTKVTVVTETAADNDALKRAVRFALENGLYDSFSEDQVAALQAIVAEIPG